MLEAKALLVLTLISGGYGNAQSGVAMEWVDEDKCEEIGQAWLDAVKYHSGQLTNSRSFYVCES